MLHQYLPCAYLAKVTYLVFLAPCMSMQKISSIHSFILEMQQVVESNDSVQGISPTLKYWPHPIIPRPPPQNSKSVRPPPPLPCPPPSMSNHTKNFGEIDTPPPWNLPTSKKAKIHFLKKQKILFPTMK